MRRVLTLAFVLAALPAMADQGSPASSASGPAPRPVVSETITAVPDASDFFIGTVDARVQTDLGFPVAGTIAERPVEIGDRVAKGDLLACLDPLDLDADVDAAQAGVTVATAQLRTARDAQSRAAELVKRKVDSKVQLEALDRALTSAQARLEQAQATLARATDARGYARLTAPQDGVITMVYLEAGAAVAMGASVVRLVGTDRLEVVMDLAEQDLISLDGNSSFDAALIANPEITTRVTLSRIDPVANRSTRTRRVRLALTDPPASFRLGALVRILPSSGRKAGISLPKSAILDGGTDAPFVWLVERSDNTLIRRPVVTGKAYGNRVRIEKGLSLGDEVMLKGIHSVEEGQTVGPQVAQ